MIIKIPKGTAIAFRNPQILCVDTKRVTLERALTNLYMKIFAQGAPLTLAYKKEHDIESLEGSWSAPRRIWMPLKTGSAAACWIWFSVATWLRKR